MMTDVRHECSNSRVDVLFDEVAELRARAKINDTNITATMIDLRELAVTFKGLIVQQREQHDAFMERATSKFNQLDCHIRVLADIVLRMKHGKKGDQP